MIWIAGSPGNVTLCQRGAIFSLGAQSEIQGNCCAELACSADPQHPQHSAKSAAVDGDTTECGHAAALVVCRNTHVNNPKACARQTKWTFASHSCGFACAGIWIAGCPGWPTEHKLQFMACILRSNETGVLNWHAPPNDSRLQACRACARHALNLEARACTHDVVCISWLASARQTAQL